MHRALVREGLGARRGAADYRLHRDTSTTRIVGQVLDKRLAGDDLGDRIALTIDGTDGGVHYVEAQAAQVEDARRGSIVAVEPPPSRPRNADRNILAAADASGAYSPSRHREMVAASGVSDPERFVQTHIRRLEALRRAGIVERLHTEHWTVPADLPERGLAHDRTRHGPGARVTELSPLSLDQQVRHEGATWLDRTMLGNGRQSMAHGGFGGDVQSAWTRRRAALADMGYVRDMGEGRYQAPRDLIERLERAEVERAGRKFAAERGLEWQAAKPGERVAGTLVGQAQLRKRAVHHDRQRAGLPARAVERRTRKASGAPRRRHSHARRRHRLDAWPKPGARTLSALDRPDQQASAIRRRPSRPSPSGGAVRAGLDRRPLSAAWKGCAGTEERTCAEPKNGRESAVRATPGPPGNAGGRRSPVSARGSARRSVA